MATKKFVIEMEEGDTECKHCPIEDCSKISIDCSKYNFATMKITEMEETTMTVGQLIKILAYDAGLNRKELAKKMGISEVSLNEVISGKIKL